MQLAYPQNDTRAETLRYLGAGGWQPDAASQVLLQKAEDALRAAPTRFGLVTVAPFTAVAGGLLLTRQNPKDQNSLRR